MSDWINVTAQDQLAEGERILVDVDDVNVVIFNIKGELFAIEDVCTHDGSEIASGCLKGEDIECPRHGARFNVRTGEVTAPPAYEPIDTFPVQVVNGVIQVRDPRWD